MELHLKKKERPISELIKEIKIPNERVETMDRSLNCHEQYSRRNCLLIHGMKENEKENTDNY